MYQVYGSISSRAFRVLWALEELGQPYELIYTGPHSDAIRAVNPSGKVPALKVGEDVLTDSSAILTYLADKHAALIAPAGTIERARQDGLLHQILDELDAVLWTAARHSFVLPEAHRAPEVKPSLKWEFERNVTRLASQIDTEFAAGDSFTIVDIVLSHCLNWAFSAKFPHGSDTMTDYAKRMRARAAFQRVLAHVQS